jgi:hypothetical protein
MQQPIGIRFDATDRMTIDEARRSWVAERFGPGATLDIMPPLGGPDPSGKMTMHRVEPDFVNFLRSNGFQFELI